ncbi:MAG: TetR family transcriptional regulator [Candidimonas sp.]|nr:MAG: TetR family transcriptional regulator [Candidimonas sp.]
MNKPSEIPAGIEGRLSTRDLLIRAGVEQCTEGGFQMTGIETILRAVGVPKGSFYHYFKSKKAFGLAVVDAYADFFHRKLQRIFSDEQTPPLGRLRNFVSEAVSGMSRYAFRRGCLVGNLGQELAGLDDEFRRRLEEVLRAWEAQTRRCLEQAQAAGELRKEANAGELAEFFWIGWEGAILRAKLTRSARPMHLFSDCFFKQVATR